MSSTNSFSHLLTFHSLTEQEGIEDLCWFYAASEKHTCPSNFFTAFKHPLLPDVLQLGIWNPKWLEQPENFKKGTEGGLKTNAKRLQAFGFNVKNAVLFPPEVEKGMWPDDYSLSDHATLTAVFSPVRMPCFQRMC